MPVGDGSLSFAWLRKKEWKLIACDMRGVSVLSPLNHRVMFCIMDEINMALLVYRNHDDDDAMAGLLAGWMDECK